MRKYLKKLTAVFLVCAMLAMLAACGNTDSLRPVREQFDRYMADKAFLEECYRKGAARAEAISQRTLDKVYKKIGFLAK